MVTRTTLLQIFIACMGNALAQEQPGNSVMWGHDRQIMFRDRMRRIADHFHLDFVGQWHLLHTWLGAFGAPTPKLSRIGANFVEAHELRRSLTRVQIVELARANPTYSVNARRLAAGLTAVNGRPQHLRNTQVYPYAFGQSMVAAFLERRSFNPQRCAFNPTIAFPENGEFEDCWEDAHLAELALSLGLPHDVMVA